MYRGPAGVDERFRGRDLRTRDLATLEHAAQELQTRLRALNGVDTVRSSLVSGQPELRVTVDEVRAKDLGLDVAELGRIVETVVAGRRVTEMLDGGREVDLNVLAPQARVASGRTLAGRHTMISVKM